jgi:Na+/melibiose symporter-like transporter
MIASAEPDPIDAPAAAPAGFPGPVPFLDKVSYGLGQFGEGLQSSAAVSLLMFFYSQVIGLNAAVVGLGIAGYGVIMSILPVLKICGLFFPVDSSIYFPTILAVSIIGYFIQSSYGVMSGAILPDVIDDYFRQTGRRMAGIISGFLFVIITVTAAGSQLLAGVVLTLIGLQPKALPGDVPIDVSDTLGLVVSGVIAVTTLAFCIVFQRYPIVDRISRR